MIGLPSSVLAEEVHGDGTLPARHDDQQRLARQLELLERWLRSDDARATAARLLTRRGLANSADDLLQDGWVRIHESVARRSEPYRDLDQPEHAARFGARVLDNLSRDRLRAVSRRREVELIDVVGEDLVSTSATESRLLLEQLLVTVAHRAERDAEPCPGCPDRVVAAAALEMIHLVLAGHDGGERGRTWWDQMQHLALERVDGGAVRSDAAANQRKSRCGRCIDTLLRAGADDLMGASA